MWMESSSPLRLILPPNSICAVPAGAGANNATISSLACEVSQEALMSTNHKNSWSIFVIIHYIPLLCFVRIVIAH